MATYIVAPETGGAGGGTDGGSGSVGDPISLDAASGNIGSFSPQPGDIFKLRGGIYAQIWNQNSSGSAGNPIVYQPYSTETVYILGSQSASNLVKVTPDPWVDDPGEIGWSLQSYTSQTGSESDVYRKSGSALCVWVDQYESGFGASKSAGIFTNLANMSILNNYGQNPNVGSTGAGEIHSYNSSHDLMSGSTFHQHEWHSQHMNKDGYIWIRLYQAGDMDPSDHQIYASDVFNLFKGNTTSYVTIDGISNRIKFWRAKTTFDTSNNSSNIKLLNCEFAFAGHGNAVYVSSGSVACQVENCRLYGGGNTMAHEGDGIWFTAGSGSSPHIFKNNTVKYSGHTGITLRDDSGGTKAHIENNVIEYAGGVGVFVRGTSNSSTINYNDISYCGIIANSSDRTAWAHPFAHEALRIHGINNTEVRRNVLYKSGYGLAMVVQDGREYKNVDVIHNTVFDIESHGFDFRSGLTTGPPASSIDDVIIANNIFDNVSNDPGDNIDYGMMIRHIDLPGYLSKTKIHNNQFMDDGKGLGGSSWWIRNNGDSATTDNLVGMETTYSGTFSNNSESQPSFTNESTYDLTIQSGSAMRDNGTSTYTDSDVTDGNPDIGYDEFGGGGGPTNNAPVISSFTADSTIGSAPLVVNFTCSASDDNTTAANLQYDWNYGDVNSGASNTESGSGVSFSTRSHTYSHPGIYICTVTVTDDDGSPLDTDDTLQITVTSARAGTQFTTTDAAGFTFTQGGTGGTQPNANNTPEQVMDWLYNSNGGNSDGDLWARDGLLANPQWIKIDFGSNKTLTRIRTSFYKYQDNREYDYDLEYSTDDVSYTPIKTGWKSLLGSLNEFTEIDMTSPIIARYIRQTANSNSEGSDFHTVWEIQIWEDPITGGVGDPIPVISAEDRVGNTHLDIAERFNPGFIFDSRGPDVATPHERWIGSRRLIDGDEWIYCDFGADKTVKQVEIAFYRGAQGVTYTYDLQKSLNATPDTFVNIAAAQTNVQEVWTVHNFGTAETARRIRLRFTASTNYACASCWEAKFFEEAP